MNESLSFTKLDKFTFRTYNDKRILPDYLFSMFPPVLPLGHRTAGSFRQGRHPPLLPLLLVTSVLRICVTSEGLFYVLEAIAFFTLAAFSLDHSRLSPFIHRRFYWSIATITGYLCTRGKEGYLYTYRKNRYRKNLRIYICCEKYSDKYIKMSIIF